MKKVFTDSNAIAHLWAAQAQEEARNSGYGNFYFTGLTIYSYGHHFAIAQIYNKDNDIVFFNSSGYSNTTAKHQSVVRHAIKHKTIFTLPYVELNSCFVDEQHVRNLKYYFNILEELTRKQKKARVYNYLGEIESNLQQLKDYVKLFKLNSKLTKVEKSVLLLNAANDLFENCNFTELRVKKAKQQTAKQLKKDKQRIFDFCGCKVPYKKDKCYLRVNGDQIQTSQSANVPIREAKILYDRIQAGKDVKGFKIGYYTVISVNGALKIGCHSIERDEMARIAKILNW